MVSCAFELTGLFASNIEDLQKRVVHIVKGLLIKIVTNQLPTLILVTYKNLLFFDHNVKIAQGLLYLISFA